MYQVLAVFNAIDNISGVAAAIGSNVETLSGKVTQLGEDMTAVGTRLTAGLTAPISGLAE